MSEQYQSFRDVFPTVRVPGPGEPSTFLVVESPESAYRGMECSRALIPITLIVWLMDVA